MRIGMICRMDNSGLGNLSWEFARHLNPTKVLLVENGVFQTFPERYEQFDNRRGTSGNIDWFLDGIDVVVTAETFYDWSIVSQAKKKGIKTALITMCEMSPEKFSVDPDLFICPSLLDYDMFEDTGKAVYIPMPVATDRLKWRRRGQAKHFVHTASHGGMNMRKGTPLLLQAMPYVKSDIKLTVYSWVSFNCTDKRVEMKRVNFKNYWQLWKEGDVLIYPQDYNGICLPIQEAFASGLGVLTTDIYPFNKFLPTEMMFNAENFYTTQASNGLRKVRAAKIDPKELAAKIDEWAGRDIGHLSDLGNEWAQKNSWEALTKDYLLAFEKLCAE